MEENRVISSTRRLGVITNHLFSESADQPSLLRSVRTSSQLFSEQGYSVVLPQISQEGESNIYRSVHSPLKLITTFPNHPEISTLHDNFERSAEIFRDERYLGTRVGVDGSVGEYRWMTYGEAATARSSIGSGLLNHGIPKGSCIGLYFINRPEWMIVDHACCAYSYVSVPLYDTLGPDAVNFIINHATVRAIFCVRQTLDTLLSSLSKIPSVRLVVVVGGADGQMLPLPLKPGVEVVSYSELLKQGQSNLQPFRPPKPADIATICYTSGTTGNPKGAVLSHGGLIANVAGATYKIIWNTSDVYISYLPLAHIYERYHQIMVPYYGTAVGFYQGDNTKLLDDMVQLRPTIFCSVPRLFNKIYASILNSIKASGREKLFTASFNAKKQSIMTGKNPSPTWDDVIFNNIKEKLGGRVRFMFSAAAPLSPDVMDFLRVCFDGHVIEAYGMTENSCMISCMDANDYLNGHVGSPNPACEVKLVDVPEMEYTSKDRPYPRGEICVRGPTVFSGYFKDEVQTKEAMDEDKWLHTGDIGMWLPEGRLKIIDRKKNIFKMAQGEYVAPEKLENVYAKCKFVAQCFIHGDSTKSALVAVISLDQDVLKPWAFAEGIMYENLHQLCNDPRTKAAVLADMDVVGRQSQLRGFEFAKAVTLVLEPFTLDNGLLTPTFKIKRAAAKAYFAKEISMMYAELSASETSEKKLL
ncbi:long chain acyl-CoA synthetase 6, peroxisomal [Daucus carota subsp. sativus]|uniref:long chain acyl-CoA synthetase 6, peroxisomal n=1 Tax=Daucus carota subsp. sativus TaxID=79200 RepID=UPI0007EF6109|nr:PREDICTED: long chain acyl-CoA synthetase 6, peroxisomal-like [Daucus carota subsp. sativus]